MIPHENIFAYIDGANLHKGVANLGWELDYARFRVWLKEKYGVVTAYLFLGLIPKYKDLYTKLQEDGFTLVFKEVTYDSNGKAKGNCDADFVLHVTRDFYENKFKQAVIVSSDGDYTSLVKFLAENNKLRIILSPAVEKKCSILLKKLNVPITFLNNFKTHLTMKKPPTRTEPRKGLFRGDG